MLVASVPVWSPCPTPPTGVVCDHPPEEILGLEALPQGRLLEKPKQRQRMEGFLLVCVYILCMRCVYVCM